MDGFILSYSSLSNHKMTFVVCLRCFFGLSRRSCFFELLADCPLSRSCFWKRSFVCDCANASSASFFWLSFLTGDFLSKEARWGSLIFKDKISTNHSYNILTNNRLSDLIYPSLQHRALPYKSHASATAHCSNHQQCNQTWLKSPENRWPKQSHQKLPSHF